MKFSALDAFPKVESSYVERRRFGGIVSVLVAVALCLLVRHEFAEYFSRHRKYAFLVDREISQPLQLNVDITFAMDCKYLIVHAVEGSGEQSKIRNHLQLESRTFTAKGATLLSDRLKMNEQGDSLPSSAYTSSDRLGHIVNNAVTDGSTAEGCRLYGSYEASKVSGNLHVTAMGHGHGGGHVPHEAINFTHRIDKFSFGKDYPERVNPLDNSVEVSSGDLDNFQYYLSIVPTIYQQQFGSIMFTNQYAVNEYHRGIDPSRNIWPGVYFKYSLEAISVRITEGEGRSLFNFLTRLCGVIGGIWVTTGLLYAIVNTFHGHSAAQVERKPVMKEYGKY